MRKKNYSIKIIYSVLIASLFIFIAFGSDDSKNARKWEPNNKSLFCGVEFESSHYIEQIAMDIKSKTILNEDGTYTSVSGWEAVGNKNKQEYRNTVGRSSDEDNNFKGTWEITNSWKSDGSFEIYKPTYIKFTSSNGRISHGVIMVMKHNLELTIFDSNEALIDGENTEIYGGTIYTDIETPSQN